MSNISIFSEILSVIVGAAGVFLGLYCSNIMSMYSENMLMLHKISHGYMKMIF